MAPRFFMSRVSATGYSMNERSRFVPRWNMAMIREALDDYLVRRSGQPSPILHCGHSNRSPPRNLCWRLAVEYITRPWGSRPPNRRVFEAPFPRHIQAGEAWIGTADARYLGVQIGDSISLRVSKTADIPRESLLGRRSGAETAVVIPATVGGILDDDAPIADFSLAPGTEHPHNVFVQLAWLQEKLGEPKRINALLVRNDDQTNSVSFPTRLDQSLKSFLTLADRGLIVRTPKSRTDALMAALDRNKDGAIQPNEWRGRLGQAVVDAADADRNRTLTRQELESYFEKRGYVSLESRQMLIETGRRARCTRSGQSPRIEGFAHARVLGERDQRRQGNDSVLDRRGDGSERTADPRRRSELVVEG